MNSYVTNRRNFRTHEVKIEAEKQIKGIEIQFNEIIEKNFPNVGKEMDVQVQEACKTPRRHNQKRNSPCHIIV
jgi:hypothetical protein